MASHFTGKPGLWKNLNSLCYQGCYLRTNNTSQGDEVKDGSAAAEQRQGRARSGARAGTWRKEAVE